MLEGLDLSKMKYVVELGPGTGCFTAQLMEKLPESSEVLVLGDQSLVLPRIEGEVWKSIPRSSLKRATHG